MNNFIKEHEELIKTTLATEIEERRSESFKEMVSLIGLNEDLVNIDTLVKVVGNKLAPNFGIAISEDPLIHLVLTKKEIDFRRRLYFKLKSFVFKTLKEDQTVQLEHLSRDYWLINLNPKPIPPSKIKTIINNFLR